MFFRLSYEYKGGSAVPGHSGGNIEFEADNRSDALRSAVRWMDNRTKAAPEIFGEFVYFKLCPYSIYRIDDKGGCLTGGGFRLMEWSLDRAFIERDTYVDWKCSEWELSETRATKA